MLLGCQASSHQLVCTPRLHRDVVGEEHQSLRVVEEEERQMHRDVGEEEPLNHKDVEEPPHQKEEAVELPQTGRVVLRTREVVLITEVGRLLPNQAAPVQTVLHQTS